jgi:hypothetical protein
MMIDAEPIWIKCIFAEEININMGSSRLYKALEDFKGAQGDIKNLSAEFNKIAKAAFYSGYFLVNGDSQSDCYKIELTCIEFYYHEDEDEDEGKKKIRDEKKYLKGKDEFGYPLGAVCPNPSGVDILFDSPDKKYHASLLIRGYKATTYNGEVYENNKKSETWNTQDLWYDLFGGASMLNKGRFSIEWVDNGTEYPNEVKMYVMERINIKDKRPWAYTKEKQTQDEVTV